jgi:predicted AAA+ superfamily ATPase
MFQETGRQIKELREESKETDRLIKELRGESQETTRQMQETDRLIKELSKNIGGVNKTLGNWAEEMTAINLCDKFNALGYNFIHANRNNKYKKDGQDFVEVDVLLENGEYAMPVEVKVSLSIELVDMHLRRLGRLREWLDWHEDKRRLMGAVAGVITPDNVKEYAQNRGLYVVAQSGDSVMIAPAPKGFTPQVW